MSAGQRSDPGFILQGITHRIFWDKISYWPGTCLVKLGWLAGASQGSIPLHLFELWDYKHTLFLHIVEIGLRQKVLDGLNYLQVPGAWAVNRHSGKRKGMHHGGSWDGCHRVIKLGLISPVLWPTTLQSNIVSIVKNFASTDPFESKYIYTTVIWVQKETKFLFSRAWPYLRCIDREVL